MSLQHGQLVSAPKVGIIGAFKRFWDDKEADWRDKVTLFGGMAYIVSPIDALPDWALPLLGLADDAIIALVVANLARKVWRTYRKAEPKAEDQDAQ